MDTRKNYEFASETLFILDACISGKASIPNADPMDKHGTVLSRLFDVELHGEMNIADEYVADLFHVFSYNKKSITITVHHIMKGVDDEEIINNLLVKPEMIEWKYGQTKFIRREAQDRTNLVNDKLITIFSNVEEITMNMNDPEKHENIYTFSLLALLLIIGGTSTKTVKMQMIWNKTDGCSWLKMLWDSHSHHLIQEYSQSGYDIQYDEILYGNAIEINKQ